MGRLFWVECPQCKTRWYLEWELRHSDHQIECPKCALELKPDEASWIDERQKP